jgi:hypothetical protein
MTRRKNPVAAEKEAQLRLAITAVLNGEHSCHFAHLAFGVPRRTLYYRVKENRKPRNQAHERGRKRVGTMDYTSYNLWISPAI